MSECPYTYKETARRCIKCNIQKPAKYRRCEDRFYNDDPQPRKTKKIVGRSKKPKLVRKAKPEKQALPWELCKGPLEENCEECETLRTCKEIDSFFTWLPKFMFYRYMKHLPPVVWKMFTYLAHLADHDPKSRQHGQCRFTFGQAEAFSGIAASHMREYLNVLQKMYLITWKYVRPSGKDTIHIVTVRYFKRLKDLRKLRK